MKTKNKVPVKPDTVTLNDQGKRTLAMLTALEDEAQLTDWEIDFVASVSDWFYKGQSLSPKQFETLEKVYRKFN
jgi:hypothetical protein